MPGSLCCCATVLALTLTATITSPHELPDAQVHLLLCHREARTLRLCTISSLGPSPGPSPNPHDPTHDPNHNPRLPIPNPNHDTPLCLLVTTSHLTLSIILTINLTPTLTLTLTLTPNATLEGECSVPSSDDPISKRHPLLSLLCSTCGSPGPNHSC